MSNGNGVGLTLSRQPPTGPTLRLIPSGGNAAVPRLISTPPSPAASTTYGQQPPASPQGGGIVLRVPTTPNRFAVSPPASPSPASSNTLSVPGTPSNNNNGSPNNGTYERTATMSISAKLQETVGAHLNSFFPKHVSLPSLSMNAKVAMLTMQCLCQSIGCGGIANLSISKFQRLARGLSME
jgi:hypothetical protein